MSYPDARYLGDKGEISARQFASERRVHGPLRHAGYEERELGVHQFSRRGRAPRNR